MQNICAMILSTYRSYKWLSIRHWGTNCEGKRIRTTLVDSKKQSKERTESYSYPITEVVRGYLQCLNKPVSLDGSILFSTFPIPEPPFEASGPGPEKWDRKPTELRI